MSDPAAAARAAIVEWFADQPGLEVERAGQDGWFTVLEGRNKRTIPMYLSVGDHTLIVESHFMRAPDENAEALYESLLKRNQRTYILRFCVYDSGDVMLVGVLPLPAVSVQEIDRLAGALLATADESYNAALRLGFASYIEREQSWREKVGLGRNPIT
ncbi:YbjN domain-containing protein [Euzebya tangerina]|uniref:YbjN domain-containing protein n=1 Tax=Euzebya tangerina TaxID=591198 RepID=UPI0013C37474|nr:YbjN domain-containing protein [Euzebya tangerina]